LTQAGRYAAWALAGAAVPIGFCLLGAAVTGENPFASGSDAAVILGFFSAVFALGSVLLRLTVGLLLKADGMRGDRIAVRGLLIFFAGALLGEAAFLFFVAACNRHLALREVVFVESLPWLVFPAAGGISLLAAAWVARRIAPRASVLRRCAGMVPLWCLLLTVATAAWLAFDADNRQRLLAMARGEPFVWREPVSRWLVWLEEDAPASRRRTAVYALSDAAADDPRALPALRRTFADPDQEIASLAIWAVREKTDSLDRVTVAALGAALGDPRREVQSAAVFALGKADPADLGPILADLCRAYAISDTEQSRSIMQLLHRHDPQIEPPEGYFSRSYWDADGAMQRRAAAAAAAMRQLGPTAVDAYRAALCELLASEELGDRRFGAVALGGLGEDAKDAAAALQRVVEHPANPFGSDALAAAFALLDIGATSEGAQALAGVLTRFSLVAERHYLGDDRNPWRELERLPPAIRSQLPLPVQRRLASPPDASR
jgi:hypothetical protein